MLHNTIQCIWQYIYHKFILRDYVPLQMVKIHGRKFIQGFGGELQCPYCLYVHHASKLMGTNLLLAPDYRVLGYIHNKDEEAHADTCPYQVKKNSKKG